MERKCTGIIIDDEEDLLDLYADYFFLKGFSIIGKGIDGCQAEQLFIEKKPDFVILDINMPNYDGYYAIKKIKEKDPNAKIFVITGHNTCSLGEGEVEGIYQKPVNMKIVYDHICKSVCNNLPSSELV
ncbi:MAG: response regulator [Thaumarchaeota archaeon]|nr:MAG: response regulator [Nitrososphaerota archaeon]